MRAVAITGGLMLLVYAMTHATQHGWLTGALDVVRLNGAAAPTFK